MVDKSSFRPNLDIFGVPKRDAGWIYVIENGHLIKVGKTMNPRRRLEEAMTWVPDLEVIGVKPFWNIGTVERMLHEGLASYWHAGEWFKIWDPAVYELITQGFCEFYDQDRDMNSVDFIYWYNSSGLQEFAIERRAQGLSLRQWLRSPSN